MIILGIETSCDDPGTIRLRRSYGARNDHFMFALYLIIQ